MHKISKLLFLNLAVVAIVLIIDRVTKVFFLFSENQLEIINSKLFSLSLAKSINTNFAFSIPSPMALIMAVVLLVFALVVWFWVKEIKQHHVHSIWLGLSVGGAVGNIVDRIQYGGVVDWIEISFFSYTWSSFNVADIAILVGVLGWGILSHKERHKQKINQ